MGDPRAHTALDRRAFLGILSKGTVGVAMTAGMGCDANDAGGAGDSYADVVPITPGTSFPARDTSWLMAQRVHAHTHVGPRYWADPVFQEVEERLARLGAKVITRYVRMGGEPAWWVDGGGRPGRAEVRTMVDRAHARGQRIIGYYWHTSDEAAAAEHPDWICRGPDGGVQSSNRGAFLDLTSAWRERVLTDLLTMGELGFDGVYFDARHFPDAGCFGGELARRFELTGALPQGADERDAAYRAFIDHQAAATIETFRWWKSQVADAYPGLAFIVSTSVLAALINRRVTTDLVRVVDSGKTELRLAVNGRANFGVFARRRGPVAPPTSIRVSLSWALLRDAAPGRAAHVWLNRLPTRRAFEDVGAAVLAWGGIANFNVETAALLDDPAAAEQTEGLRAAFALGEWAAPHLEGVTPVAWGGVAFSEQARNAFGGEVARAWRALLWPVTGAFGAFVAEGLPVQIVDDDRLRGDDFEDLRVLFVADRAGLADAQRTAVDRFEARGGIVIENEASWRWHLEGMGAAGPLQARLRSLAREAPVTGVALEGCHLVAYNRPGRNPVVALAPPFGWVLDEGAPPPRAEVNFASSRWAHATDLRTGRSLAGTRGEHGWSFRAEVDGLTLIEMA